jgi:8-oxo-dGTP diphosphatase
MNLSGKDWEWAQKNVPILCVDGIVVTDKGEVLLTKREIEPFLGFWHLPGGRVDYKETVEEAVARVVMEETGVKAERMSLVGVYSDSKRDPRGHFVTVAFLMKPVGGKLKSDFQSSEVKYFKKLPKKMGFDAKKVAEDGLRVWRALRP